MLLAGKIQERKATATARPTAESKVTSKNQLAKVYLVSVAAAVDMVAIAGKSGCVVYAHCLPCKAVALAAEYMLTQGPWLIGNRLYCLGCGQAP